MLPDPRRRVGQRRDRQHGRDREHGEPAAVEEGREFADPPEHHRDHGKAEDAGAVDQVAGPWGDVGAEAAARPDHRQRGAGEELEGAGVGPVVDPRGVDRRVVEDRHQDQRAEGGEEGDAGEPQPDPAGVRLGSRTNRVPSISRKGQTM